MKKYVFSFLCMLLIQSVAAQKQPLTLNTYKTWSSVEGGAISNDGRFVCYRIENQPLGNSTFVIKATAKKWRWQYLNVSQAQFSDDSKMLIGKLPNDTLFFYNLINQQINKISGINTYKLFKQAGNEWIAWKAVDSNNFTVKALNRVGLLTYKNVTQYQISPNGNYILINQNTKNGEKIRNIISLIDLPKGKSRIIYEGENVSNLIFDDNGKQAAFFVQLKNGNSIWYYKQGTVDAVLLVNNESDGVLKNLHIENKHWQFSHDGKSLFFTLQENAIIEHAIQNNDLEIWNYKDAYLQSYYNNIENLSPHQYLTIVRINDRKIIQLLHNQQEIVKSKYSFRHKTDSLILIQSSFGIPEEQWNPYSKVAYALCSSQDGKIHPLEINQGGSPLRHLGISNFGKYLIYFDPIKKNYFSVSTKESKNVNISQEITGGIVRYEFKDLSNPQLFPLGPLGWIGNDDALIIQGTYDIWALDPSGVRKPINLTNKIGEKNKIIFTLVNSNPGTQFRWNQEVIVTGLDLSTMNYGFYSLKLTANPKLNQLSSQPIFMGQLYSSLNGYNFSIAQKATGYLLKFERTSSVPNYYFSRDLKSFKPLSNIQPQRNYNWFSAELQTYSDSAGIQYKGILYKPENFNPKIKYPILFNYYSYKSYLLNASLDVQPVSANFNIAIAVSNGYIVFQPDMINQKGCAGKGALNSVLAAVQQLSKYPWIDTSKMGLSGHSYGGFETNYIITHTNKFAAALSGAGIFDMVNHSTSLWEQGFPEEYYLQYDIANMGSTLSEAPEVYTRNSPVLNVKKVTTPLLLLHNEGDKAVSFTQSRSCFILLRSLQKPVWLLNYKGEGHTIANEKNQLDYGNKVLGFFDYFLKNRPQPKWMSVYISPKKQ
jgi:dipeptidyl aminopeptidase/acylaminoacyl peptidase